MKHHEWPAEISAYSQGIKKGSIHKTLDIRPLVSNQKSMAGRDSDGWRSHSFIVHSRRVWAIVMTMNK